MVTVPSEPVVAVTLVDPSANAPAPVLNVMVYEGTS